MGGAMGAAINSELPMDENRFFFASTEGDPSLQVTDGGDGELTFSANNDWCGSTETGFGATVMVSLPRADIARLHAQLGAWLAATSPAVAQEAPAQRAALEQIARIDFPQPSDIKNPANGVGGNYYETQVIASRALGRLPAIGKVLEGGQRAQVVPDGARRDALDEAFAAVSKATATNLVRGPYLEVRNNALNAIRALQATSAQPAEGSADA
jgi:hypothetical protein